MQVGVDTYITVEQADAIIQGNVCSQSKQRQDWEGLSDDDKGVFLAQAMLEIESLAYIGMKADQSQPLQFPRNFQDETPDSVKQAQAFEACAACAVDQNEADTRAQLRAQGVKSFALGSLSESYDASALGDVLSVDKLKSGAAKQLLRAFLLGGIPLV